jgi:hypothetical protein
VCVCVCVCLGEGGELHGAPVTLKDNEAFPVHHSCHVLTVSL